MRSGGKLKEEEAERGREVGWGEVKGRGKGKREKREKGQREKEKERKELGRKEMRGGKRRGEWEEQERAGGEMGCVADPDPYNFSGSGSRIRSRVF